MGGVGSNLAKNVEKSRVLNQIYLYTHLNFLSNSHLFPICFPPNPHLKNFPSHPKHHPFHHPNHPIQHSTSPCFYLYSLKKDTLKYYRQTKSTLLFLLINIVKIIYFWFITYLKWTHPESELILNLLQNSLIICERKIV